MRITKGILIVCLFYGLTGSLFSALDSGEELVIFQTGQIINIDGELDEWIDAKGIPIDKSPMGKIMDPSQDISVTAFFCFDIKNFYAAVKVKDDILEFPSRSWRYGDGFYLTFLDPHKGEESDRFTTFGFSREEKQDIKVLINKDGEYFPGSEIANIQLSIKRDEKKGSVIYEIAIPWEAVSPLKPLIFEKWGINLIYVDRDNGKTEQVLQLYADQAYDTEMSKLRKGAIARFEKHVPRFPEFQSGFNAARYFHDEEKVLTLAVNSPVDVANWKIRYELSSAKDNLSFNEDLSFKKGMNFVKHTVKSRDESSGTYVLSLAVINDGNSLIQRSDHGYFVVNREELSEFKENAKKAKESAHFQEDVKFRASLPSYEIRLQWIEEFMNEAQPFADTKPLNRWFEELDILSKNIEEAKPALFPAGEISRLAHRSSIDDTLQPYSVFIPPTYTGQNPIPLFVTLHGSGVDERNVIFFLTREIFRRGNFIILAPRARGFSDWYLGNSGQDVIECIEHIKQIYNIDEKNIVLDGFSMGGYGAWRLGLLHADLFRAVIIRSGAIVPPPFIKGENILDLLEVVKGKKLNICIIHGDKDLAVPVTDARKAAAKLKELGIEYTYIEVKNAAHGDYQRWSDVFKWLNLVLIK